MKTYLRQMADELDVIEEKQKTFYGFSWSVSAYHKHTNTIVDYIAWFNSEKDAQTHCDKMNIICKSHEAFIPVRYMGELGSGYKEALPVHMKQSIS